MMGYLMGTFREFVDTWRASSVMDSYEDARARGDNAEALKHNRRLKQFYRHYIGGNPIDTLTLALIEFDYETLTSRNSGEQRK